jgi:PAS domain S-box-containing protein
VRPRRAPGEDCLQSLVIRRARELEAPDRAVIGTDTAGMVVYWGPGAQELYGWTEAQALGRDIVDLTPTELSRDEADAIMRKLRQGESWAGEFLLQDHEGSRFLAHVTNNPVRDDAGELIGIIGVSRRMEYLEPR